MAFSSSFWSFTSFFLILQLLWSCSMHADGCYTSIISFGDSLADTGNIKHQASISHAIFPFLQPPYGETFFHQPTGRCSNGRIVIDFLAESLGLPFIPPFLDENPVELRQGINYAVVGATALDTSFHEARGLVDTMTNSSLGVQLEWFKHSLPSLCPNASDCKNVFERSLFLMGEFGGNDYNLPVLTQGKPIEYVEPYVPLVTDAIVSAVNELIEIGAQTLVVTGEYPFGCSPYYLTILGSESEEYDNTTGCLVRYNKFSEYHNEMLQTKLNHLQELHPKVTIIYADFYNAAMQIIRSPDKFGFPNDALMACCGAGGRYNFDPSSPCGSPSATNVCDDPNTFVNWDGIHYSEAATRIISKNQFQGTFTSPQFSSLCPTSSQLSSSS